MSKKLNLIYLNDEEEDRISHLPDALLLHILSLMPLKCAATTSALSNRWKDLWTRLLAYATCFDFGKEFSRHRDISHLVGAINRFLELHRGSNIEKFRLYIYPKTQCRSQIGKWIRFAAEKRVKELDLHFTSSSWTHPRVFYRTFKLPFPVFTCSSLTILKLTECHLYIPKQFKGFPHLRSLCLELVFTTDRDLLETLLLNCPALERLSLKYCTFISGLKISAPGLTLKRLELLNLHSKSKIEIHTPSLLSIHINDYVGDLYLFGNLSSLKEAIITREQPPNDPLVEDYDMGIPLHHITHVKTLTICHYTIMDYIIKLEDEAHEDLPVVYPNLIELQLKMRILDEACLNSIYDLFERCYFPRLEKLFIELVRSPFHRFPEEETVEPTKEAPLECMFSHLKTIKMTCFRGYDIDMQLVKFLLERAAVLESLFLVTFNEGVTYSFDLEELLTLIHKQLLLLPKASSNAQVELCEPSKDDGSLRPTHTICW